MTWLRERLPPDAIITNGAGNYADLGAPLLPVSAASAPSWRPTSGAMGYGVPAAVAAKAVHPERTVVCFAGDGCFLMNGQELATAVQYGLRHHRHRRQQRHVRHHPHAPGARISRARRTAPT